MANFYSVSPPKKRRLAQIILLIFCLIVAFRVFFSIYLFRYFQTVIKQIDEQIGKINIADVAFDSFHGITLSDVSVIDNATPPQILFQARRLSLGFNPFDLFKKELNFNAIKCSNAQLYVDEDSQTFSKLSKILDAAYKKFLENQIIPLKMDLKNPTIVTRNTKIIIAGFSSQREGLWVLHVKGTTSLRDEKLFSHGAFIIEYKFPRASSFVKFFRDQLLQQNFDYRLVGKLTDKDLLVDRFDVTLDYDNITGQGFIKNIFDKNPLVSVIVKSSNLSIENISSLIKDFDTRGAFNVAAVARGPLNNLKFMLAVNFLGCSLHYAPLPLLRNIVGKFYISEKGLKLSDFFFITNDISFKVNSEISWPAEGTHLTADVSLKHPSRPVAFLPRSLKVDANFAPKKDSLSWNANLSYESVENNKYSLQFGDGRFTKKKDEGLLTAKRAVFLDRSATTDNNAKEKKLDFTDLSASFDFKEKYFKVTKIRATGFDGELNAEFALTVSPEYYYTSHLFTKELNSGQIEEGLSLPYNVLGKAWAKVFSHSGEKSFCEGALIIKKGKLQETALLLSLSNYMNIPSLKSIDFEDMQLYFSFLKNGIFKYGLKIRGKNSILKANIRLTKDRQVSGYFSAKLSQGLLSESAQCRKLLKIVGNEAPYVEFPFTLGGTIHVPRLSWLRNDFKRSLEHAIPAWYRKGMQREIDTTVEEMFSPTTNN